MRVIGRTKPKGAMRVKARFCWLRADPFGAQARLIGTTWPRNQPQVRLIFEQLVRGRYYFDYFPDENGTQATLFSLLYYFQVA